ncbi:MAG: hypothetical protein PVJ82_01670, partial [Desulfobacteraceae bacterium]
LFRVQLDVLGALSKPGNHLLRLAAAQPQAGLASLFDRPYARCKMGCREKLPDPSIIYLRGKQPWLAVPELRLSHQKRLRMYGGGFLLDRLLQLMFNLTHSRT